MYVPILTAGGSSQTEYTFGTNTQNEDDECDQDPHSLTLYLLFSKVTYEN